MTGWNAQLAIEPDSKSGIVILTNCDKAFYLTYDLMEQWGENELGEKVVDTEINKIRKIVYDAIVFLFLIFRSGYRAKG